MEKVGASTDVLASIENAEVRLAIQSMLADGMVLEGIYDVRNLEVEPMFKEEYDALIIQKSNLEKELTYSFDLDSVRDLLRYQLESVQAKIDTIPMREVWSDKIYNLVTTVGKNHMLDNYITGSAFTQVGPFMGLISSVSYSAIAAADTAASHAGWTEAGSTNAPTFSARIAPSWSAASAGAKAASSAVSFTMTGSGTLKGAFLVLGTGAVSTLMSTAGTLFSAGLFSGGDQVVSNGNVVQVSYSLSL
jgi:hypothetical protein